MQEQQQNIRDKSLFRFASAKRYLKVFVPGFAFKHDDNNKGKDRFVGREIQLRRLFTWLTCDSKSGSYLITGYRGMGKSLLVKRVIDMITREPKAYKEVLFQFAMIFTMIASYIWIEIKITKWLAVVLLLLALLLVAILELSKQWNHVLYEWHTRTFALHNIFSRDMIAKVWLKMRDRRRRKYNTIAVTINLGQEVLHERDVLSLIAQNVREKYSQFVHNRQNRPITSWVMIGGLCVFSFILTKVVLFPVLSELLNLLLNNLTLDSHGYDNLAVNESVAMLNVGSMNSVSLNHDGNLYDSWFTATIVSVLQWINALIHNKGPFYHPIRFSLYLIVYYIVIRTFKVLRKHAYFISVPFNSLQRLDVLSERIASTVNVETGSHPQYTSSFINLSFGNKGKSMSTPKATVRELEQELLGIINDINGDDCPPDYRSQFILVFDELDKITKQTRKSAGQEQIEEIETSPEFDPSVRGFTEDMAYEERKQNVLRLLANMKLFIASVKAKCVFISGHELFDASLADLSDREFAISSIFNGVLNVSSFLSPEREQSDVSSMTEMYLATMLLPDDYLEKKVLNNVHDNGVLKEELPSLRWYNEYLMEIHVQNNTLLQTKDEIRERVEQIRHVMEFLRCFSVYLSHVSNGSPKKISTYFEKYVKVNYDATRQFDWYDEIVVGKPSEKDARKQCVLFFTPNDQKLINFVHYIASPVMSAITNEVSNYGDKLLVSSSFILDQIYKYHGKGFSWRNLEQMPELLNLNKNPELRDSMSSIVDFLLQTHINLISSGVFQYKFHKQISEEISNLSKTSEEAAAMFNFTLNESETVKRYNIRLLWHYVNLAKNLNDKNRYNTVLERIHENLGDIYFSEEDYYRAIHEYRSALQCMSIKELNEVNLLPYLKCSLKVGMSYEYRRTFENAYMVYCGIINKLIQFQCFEENKLGLEHIMRLTGDWRLKQPMLVDAKAYDKLIEKEDNANYKRQIRTLLLENIDVTKGFKPEYSLDSDKIISGLSSNYTPLKSSIFLKLTAFEDVKYIYQAIIAKLFVIEKMEVSGITQSSIDAAEAEFITLYRATNFQEKFMMAVDFFSKLAGILYYKNNFVTASPIDNVSAALYVFDINVLAMLDDYCFKESITGNAVKIKDDVRTFFDTLKVDPKRTINSYIDLLTNEIRKKYNKQSSTVKLEHVEGYLKYLDEIQFGIQPKATNWLWYKLIECSQRRNKLTDSGCKLPCNACKYANRSLLILMDKMFAGFDYFESLKDSKVITLLRNTSHRSIRYLRREHLSALANTSEQLADIMLACAYTNDPNEQSDIDDTIDGETINLLFKLTQSIVTEDKRKKLFDDFAKEFSQNKIKLGKLDRALLYYWAACRYYEIASMYQESIHCIERIAKVIEDYLMVVLFKVRGLTIDTDKWVDLLGFLFTHASRTVGRQYDNFDMAEIHELKWLFHLDHADDIDLTHLTQFPNLQSVFLSLVRSKVMLFQLNDKNDNLNEYILKVYKRVAPSLRKEFTFKSEVELNRTKVMLNRIIFVELMHEDFIKKYRENLKNEKNRESLKNEKTQDSSKIEESLKYHILIYGKLKDFLTSGKQNFEDKLFKTDGSVQSRLDLLDYLVFDSMVCLYDILKFLPPHNQITTFSKSFIADVYYDLWEWSKYYEMLYNLYLYYRYYCADDNNGKIKVMNMFTHKSEKSDNKKDEKLLKELLEQCAELMCKDNVSCKDDFGYRYNKLFMNLRHELDDETIHHIYTNYSAEMAVKYYLAARGENSEGIEYKNLIYGMYVLDDDLRNDTCQANLADERYLLNSGIISCKRKEIQKFYEKSRINDMVIYEYPAKNNSITNPFEQLKDRYYDSPFINTEY